MIKKTVIFDFDGTIVDSAELLIKIFNIMAPKYGYPAVTLDQAHHFRGEQSGAITKALPVPFYKLPLILRTGREEYKKSLPHLEIIPGMREVLLELKKEDYSLGIVSSNTVATVKHFIERKEINFFDFVYSTGIFGKDKMLKKVMKERKLKPKDVLYIGDETRDVDAGNRVGLHTIAVAWGFNTPAALHKAKPAHFVETPEQLLQQIREESID